MKLYARLFLSLLLGLTIFSCCNKPENERESKTLLIYMAANNNLARDAYDNVIDIMSGYLPGYDDKDKLLVYLDVDYNRIPTNPAVNDDIFKQPSLIRLYKDDTGEAIVEIVRKFEESVDSTVPEFFSEVLTYVDRIFPSDRAGLVLWSHSTGWLPKGYYNTPYSILNGVMVAHTAEIDPYAHMVKSFGQDSKTGQEMDLMEMSEAFPRKYDYIIFDCCLMGGVEVAYELRSVCNYMLFSPTEILSSGFPYDVIIEPLLKEDVADLEKAAELYFDFYDKHPYGGDWRSATISLIDMAEIENLAEKSKELIRLNGSKLSELDKNRIQRYSRFSSKDWFFDLSDLYGQLSEISPEQRNAYNDFTEALNKTVTYKAATDKFISIVIDPLKYSGLSTYIPLPANNVLDTYYKKLAWNRAVGLIE